MPHFPPMVIYPTHTCHRVEWATKYTRDQTDTWLLGLALQGLLSFAKTDGRIFHILKTLTVVLAPGTKSQGWKPRKHLLEHNYIGLNSVTSWYMSGTGKYSVTAPTPLSTALLVATHSLSHGLMFAMWLTWCHIFPHSTHKIIAYDYTTVQYCT